MRAEHIRDAVMRRFGGISEMEIAGCREFVESANQRLREAKHLREKGLLEESVRILQEPVDLFGELGVLDPVADDLDAQRTGGSVSEAASFPAVEWELFEEAIDGRARAERLRPLLVAHHRGAFKQKNVDARYAILQQLTVGDPKDPAWHTEMAALEPDRLLRLTRAATELLEEPEVKAVEEALRSGVDLPADAQGPHFMELREIRQKLEGHRHISPPKVLTEQVAGYVDAVENWTNALRDFEHLRVVVDDLLRQKRPWSWIEADWIRLAGACQVLKRPVPPDLVRKTDDAKRKASVVIGLRRLLVAGFVLAICVAGWLGFGEWRTRVHWDEVAARLNVLLEQERVGEFFAEVDGLGPASSFPRRVEDLVNRGTDLRLDLKREANDRERLDLARTEAMRGWLQAVLERDYEAVDRYRSDFADANIELPMLQQIDGLEELHAQIGGLTQGRVPALGGDRGSALCELILDTVGGPPIEVFKNGRRGRGPFDSAYGTDHPAARARGFEGGRRIVDEEEGYRGWEDAVEELRDSEKILMQLDLVIPRVTRLSTLVTDVAERFPWTQESLKTLNAGLPLVVKKAEVQRAAWSAEVESARKRAAATTADQALLAGLSRDFGNPREMMDRLEAYGRAWPNSMLAQESRGAMGPLRLAAQWVDWSTLQKLYPRDMGSAMGFEKHQQAVSRFLSNCDDGVLRERVSEWYQSTLSGPPSRANSLFGEFLRTPADKGWIGMYRLKTGGRTLYCWDKPRSVGGEMYSYKLVTDPRLPAPRKKSEALPGVVIDTPFATAFERLSAPFDNSDDWFWERIVVDVVVEIQQLEVPAQLRSRLARELLTRALGSGSGWLSDAALRDEMTTYLAALEGLPADTEWDWSDSTKGASEDLHLRALMSVPPGRLRDLLEAVRTRRAALLRDLSDHRRIVGFVTIKFGAKTIEVESDMSRGVLETPVVRGSSLFRVIGRVNSHGRGWAREDGTNLDALPVGAPVFWNRED